MRQGAQTALILGLTAAALVGLGAARPFVHLSDTLDRLYDAAPRWAQVTNLLRDPAVMDASTGERPLESLRRLEQEWARHPNEPRVVFLGNSQMQAISLAPGEPPPSQPEATYVDQVALRMRDAGQPVRVYRLSAGGLTYQEALWYATVLASNPMLKPDMLVVQLNYQAFWLGGIRDGMLDLLQDPPAREALGRLAAGQAPFAPLFRGAIDEFTRREAHQGKASAAAAPAEALGFGARLEKGARSRLEAVSVFHQRHDDKDEFLALLYRLRLYVLRLTPSTARSITGPRLDRNRASLEALAELCRREGIRLVLFQAPLNPRVQLYRTEEDRRGYLQFVGDFAARHQLRVYDFETAVPAELWGRWFNGPDPLHLGREAHKQFSARVELMVRNGLAAQ